MCSGLHAPCLIGSCCIYWGTTTVRRAWYTVTIDQTALITTSIMAIPLRGSKGGLSLLLGSRLASLCMFVYLLQEIAVDTLGNIQWFFITLNVFVLFYYISIDPYKGIDCKWNSIIIDVFTLTMEHLKSNKKGQQHWDYQFWCNKSYKCLIVV